MKRRFLVVMAGGSGTRFWPVSTEEKPKQFLDILGLGKSLLQMTVERFEGIVPMENVLVVTNKEYLNLVKEQLPFVMEENILLEPVGRNTTPCVAYAAYKISSRVKDAHLIVSPADHLVMNVADFKEKINLAIKSSQEQEIITLGIRPSNPNTGYGYIQFSECQDDSSICKVKTFTEKPNLELAKAFVESGDYLWNSGLFIFTAKTFKKELETHVERMAEQFSEGNNLYYTEAEEEFIQKIYAVVKSISIDHAIMEKTYHISVIPANFGWTDLGTWNTLYEQMPKDSNNNAVSGSVILKETEDCVVHISKGKKLVAQGLKNMIIAEADGNILICSKDQEQMVKVFREEANQLD